MNARTELHPPAVRVWHWANALCFFVLIATGAQIRYRGVIDLMSFDEAVRLHNGCGILLIGLLLFWAAYYLPGGKVRIYLPDLHLGRSVPDALKQARYYGYGIFIGEQNPFHAVPGRKFNPLQQAAYFCIMVLMLPLQSVTGVLLLDLDRFAGAIDHLGGIKFVSAVHLLLTFCFTAFLFVHLYLSTLGHPWWAHLKAMFTGFEDEPGYPR